MKILLDIIRYLLSGVLAITIFLIYVSNLALSTFLSEGYVISKLLENNYHKMIYDDFNENIKKYIMQSGLDETIIDGVCSIEKVEEDTKLILDNIYNRKDNIIEVESIRNNLNNNINSFLGDKELTEESQKSIEEFVQMICDEYSDTIFPKNLVKIINSYLKVILQITQRIKKNCERIFIGIIILIFILNIKMPFRNISLAGMSILLFGFGLIYAKYLLLKNIEINNLYFLSDAFSNTLKNVINQNLADIIHESKIYIIIGTCLIAIGNIFQYGFKKENDK